MLGPDFVPGLKDVMVGRGKVCYKHQGNQNLTSIVQSVLASYSDANATKKDKTELIKSIVTRVRDSSPTGGFVKYDKEAGQWYEVGERIAREKVSQTFRDALTDAYKSSTTSKTLRRRQERINRESPGTPKEASGQENTDTTLTAAPLAPQTVTSTMSDAARFNLPPVSPGVRDLMAFSSLRLSSPRHPAVVSPSLGTITSQQNSFPGSMLGRVRRPMGTAPFAHVSPMSASPMGASPIMGANSMSSTMSASAGLGGGVGLSQQSPSLKLALALAQRRQILQSTVLSNRSFGRTAPSLNGGFINGFNPPQL